MFWDSREFAVGKFVGGKRWKSVALFAKKFGPGAKIFFSVNTHTSAHLNLTYSMSDLPFYSDTFMKISAHTLSY